MAILKNHTFDFAKEYERLLDSQHFDTDLLDYSVLDRHVKLLSQIAKMSHCGVTIYDNNRREHAFVSYNFPKMFGYDMQRIEDEDSDYFALHIHPDDIATLFKNGAIGLRYAIECKRDKVFNRKIINEYRIKLSGQYVRVVEQFSVLELDSRGNIWLTLSILDISPNQSPLDKVESRIVDFETSEVFQLPKYPEYEDTQVLLTAGERQVLSLVKNGLSSKMIADRLSISVHTVNTYRQRIIGKLDAGNSHEAVRLAAKLGLLE